MKKIDLINMIGMLIGILVNIVIFHRLARGVIF